MSGLAFPGLAPPASLLLPYPVWGIDPSTKRIALCALNPEPDGPRIDVGAFELPQLDKGARRLSQAHYVLSKAFTRAAAIASPRLVLVEQPFAGGAKGDGDFRPHPQSYFMCGVVLAVLGESVHHDCKIATVDPMTWKRDAMGQGNGNAKKEQILAWAQNAGYTGRDQDEADALGIATAAGVRADGTPAE